jgi:integrase
MPRQAKPYLHRGWWVTNIGGNRHKLCREEEGHDAAADAFDNLKQERRHNMGRTFPKLRVIELVALFLDSMKVEKSHHTYLDYQRWLTEFSNSHGNDLAREVSRQDALNFRNAIANSTYTTGRLPVTPARPGEIRKLTWVMIDWPNHRLVISRHKTSRTQRTPKARIIPIPPFVKSMLRWLQKRQGHQPYCFLNSEGKAWTKDATVQHCALSSLRKTFPGFPDTWEWHEMSSSLPTSNETRKKATIASRRLLARSWPTTTNARSTT